MSQIQIYKNSTDTEGVATDHLKVLKGIQSGNWRPQIELLNEMDQETYTIQKRNLPCVTFAGTFVKRLADGLMEYSSMIILDVDNITKDDIKMYRDAFAKDKFIYSCFVSPSGLGVKILVKIDSGASNHLQAYLSLEEYFKSTYAIILDKSGKDICRLCYVSYDPDIIINENAETYHVDVSTVLKSVVTSNFDSRPERFKGYVLAKDSKYTFDTCVVWTEKTHQYVQGDRNTFIHVLGCNMNRAGIYIDDAILMTYNNYSDLPFKETEAAIKSAYRRQYEHNSIDVYNLDMKDLPEHKEDLGYSAAEETVYYDTMTLLKAGVKNNVISKLVKTFGTLHLKLDEKLVSQVMNEAVIKFKEKNEQHAFPLLNISQSIQAYLDSGVTEGGISTIVPEFDDAIGGGISKGSFVGLIADGGCYKSIYAQCIASRAMAEDKVVLYLCGEMSLSQIMTRVVEKELGVRDVKTVTPEMAEELKNKLKNNFFLTTSTDWTKEGILQIVEKIRIETGKDVELICIDGITQMHDIQKNEILSAIANAEICKKVSKEANEGRGSVVIALVHVSGQSNKHFRNTFQFARGAKKMLNNMDAYICHSLLIDEQNSDVDNLDIFYRPNIFYLRLIDKRNSGMIVSKIIQVHRPLELEVLSVDPSAMEVKIS